MQQGGSPQARKQAGVGKQRSPFLQAGGLVDGHVSDDLGQFVLDLFWGERPFSVELQGLEGFIVVAVLDEPARGLVKEGQTEEEEKGGNEGEGDGEAPAALVAVRVVPEGDGVADPVMKLSDVMENYE